MGNNSRFPSGAFIEFNEAETWIKKNKLSGMLSALPVNEGIFDWAVANDAHSMKKETVLKKLNDPDFIGMFTTSTIDHYHYENGNRD